MNKNIECLIEACKIQNIEYKLHHFNLLEIVIANQSCLFVNWTTPLNKHSIAHLQRDKDYFFSFFKDTINMPKTKSYLNPHCDDRYSKYLKFKTISEIRYDIEKNFNFPIIIKKNRGSWGTNVFKINDSISLEKSLITIFNENSSKYDYIALAQEYIDIQTEYRAIFYKGKLQFCYEKDTTNAILKDNLSPFHQEGAKAILVNDKQLLNRISKFVQPIFTKLDITYTGVDIAIDKNNKFWLIEANSSPGFDNIIRAGYKKTIINLYLKIIEDIQKNLNMINYNNK